MSLGVNRYFICSFILVKKLSLQIKDVLSLAYYCIKIIHFVPTPVTFIICNVSAYALYFSNTIHTRFQYVEKILYECIMTANVQNLTVI